MRHQTSLFLLAIVVVVSLYGCASNRSSTTIFPEVQRIEGELRRGISTKIDVQKLFGDPAGIGNAVFPTDPRAREVWCYPDIEVIAARLVTGRNWTHSVSLRHQILLVFFDKDRFDGSLWYSNLDRDKDRKQDRSPPERWVVGRIEYGWPPRTDPIDTLSVGVSSLADVLLALGEPRGNGMVRFPSDSTSRRIWFYEQTRIDEGWRVYLKILLVFLRGDRYDGHLWFSSVQSAGTKK